MRGDPQILNAPSLAIVGTRRPTLYGTQMAIEGAQYSGSLITARLAMEFGREVFGVPGNLTQAVSFAANLLIKLDAKLVTCGEDVIEELPTPVRAALTQSDQPGFEQRNLLVAASLTGSGQKI